MTDRQAGALGLDLAGVFEIIIADAGRRTREGMTQAQVAEELHRASPGSEPSARPDESYEGREEPWFRVPRPPPICRGDALMMSIDPTRSPSRDDATVACVLRLDRPCRMTTRERPSRELCGVVGDELLERARGAAEQRRNIVGDLVRVACSEQLRSLGVVRRDRLREPGVDHCLPLLIIGDGLKRIGRARTRENIKAASASESDSGPVGQ